WPARPTSTCVAELRETVPNGSPGNGWAGSIPAGDTTTFVRRDGGSMIKTDPVPVPMDEHTTESPQSWRERQKAAAKKKAAAMWEDTKKSSRSIVYRNRRQLYPLAYTSATAAVGTTGALVAEYSDLAMPTVVMGTGAVALGAGYTALRKVGKKL